MRTVLLYTKLLLAVIGVIMTFLYDAVRTWASGVFGATSQQIDYWGVWVFVGSVVIFMFISTIQDLIKETSRAKIMSVGRPVWEPKGFKAVGAKLTYKRTKLLV